MYKPKIKSASRTHFTIVRKQNVQAVNKSKCRSRCRTPAHDIVRRVHAHRAESPALWWCICAPPPPPLLRELSILVRYVQIVYIYISMYVRANQRTKMQRPQVCISDCLSLASISRFQQTLLKCYYIYMHIYIFYTCGGSR